ncbi:preprotein translocase subunit SecE [bacterium]|nr:preprotein translocase subunit SecE [bacterium]
MREKSKIEKFLREVWVELTQKVTWSTKKELIEMTAVILLFILLWGTFIGLVDATFAKGLQKFLEFANP